MLDRTHPPPSRRQPAADSTARARNQREYRRRQRDGIAVAPVPFDGKVVDFLIATGWLDAALTDDRAEVGKAIGAMVAARERC